MIIAVNFYCDDHSPLSSITAVQNELFHLFHINNNNILKMVEMKANLK